jgi:hypothetical protein
MKTFTFIVVLIIFLLGLYFICNYTSNDLREGFKLGPNSCPNVLIQDGSKFLLHNTNKLEIPGVNPIPFNNLEDYGEFIEWQRSQNINCPVLYLQKTLNTQGEVEYKTRPSPFDTQGGISPEVPLPNNIKLGMDTKMDPNVTKSSALSENVDINISVDDNKLYAGFDPTNQDVGDNTSLDKMYHDTIPKGYSQSTNPMDPDWGGANFTQKFIDSGYFAENEVSIAVA